MDTLAEGQRCLPGRELGHTDCVISAWPRSLTAPVWFGCPCNTVSFLTGQRALGDFGAAARLGDAIYENTATHQPSTDSRLDPFIASTSLDRFALAVTLLDCCGAWVVGPVHPSAETLAAAADANVFDGPLKKFILDLLEDALPLGWQCAKVQGV